MARMARMVGIVVVLGMMCRPAMAASPACYAAMLKAYGMPAPTPPVKWPDAQACISRVFQHEMDVRRAGCNTGDQMGFCKGLPSHSGGPAHANIPNPGISGGIPKDMDCPIRSLAYEYAVKIQGQLRGDKLKMVHDALQLEDCGEVFTPFMTPVNRSFSTADHPTAIVVDSENGRDTNSGFGYSSAVRTIQKAVQVAGRIPYEKRPVAIILRGGVHLLSETIELSWEHSNVTFVSAPNEQATVSGTIPLKLSWSPFKVDKSTGMNIYVADVGGQAASIDGLRVNGGRAIRARYPNSDPEMVQDTCDQGKTSKEGCPYIMVYQEPQNWTAPKDMGTPRTNEVTSPNRYDVAPEFGVYSIGVGGACSVYSPPESYWCSNHTSGGGAFTFRTPSGLEYSPGTFPRDSKWTDPVGDGGIINIWRPSRWSNWMFKMEHFDLAARTISFGYGGFQGARGDDNGGDFFIENVREELDYPGEFFFDKKADKLFYFHNESAGTPIPENTVFEATKLDTLFKHVGNQSRPIVGVNYWGVTFTGSNIQYMNPHGVPSGGDWALQRDAALYFEGTEDVNVTGCEFIRLDGNGLILSGYNRRALIAENEFSYIGDSVIVSWGHTKEVDGAEGIDGTNGDQPRQTSVISNIIHENGHYSKQASPYIQAKSAQTLLKGNIFFNGPRAGVNFNDGFGGGNELTENLIFNYCRESSDHGPFNSWDRVPFLTDVSGTPTLTPLFNEIHHNFLIANYESSMCVDNDDGSAYYKIHDNVCHGGGKKSDFAGHSKWTYNSLEIAPKRDTCSRVMPSMDSVPEYYFNNTCIQLGNTGNETNLPPFAYVNGCNRTTGAIEDEKALTIMHDNRIYNPYGDTKVSCDDLAPPWSPYVFTFAEWQKLGYDKGTTIGKTPPMNEIVNIAKSILGM